jgi:hypothetical protein
VWTTQDSYQTTSKNPLEGNPSSQADSPEGNETGRENESQY